MQMPLSLRHAWRPLLPGLLFLLAGCGGGGDADPVAPAQAAAQAVAPVEWLGSLSLDGRPPITFRLVVTPTATTWSGRYDDLEGASATLSGTVSSTQQLSLTLRSTSAACPVSLNLQGTVNPLGYALDFSHAGTRCGVAISGRGTAILQPGHILAYGLDAPSGLTSDGDRLLFFIGGDKALVSMPKAGGAMRTLAWRIGVPDAMKRLPSGELLWTETRSGESPWGCSAITAVRHLYLGSATGGSRRKLDEVDGCRMGGRSMAADDTYIYWAGRRDQPGELRRIPLAGGAASTLYAGTSGIGDIALDANYLYWVEGGSRLRRMPLAGGAVTDLVGADAGLSFRGPMVRRGGYLYAAIWTPDDAYALVRLPTQGGTLRTLVKMPPISIGVGMAELLRFFVDATGLYWIATDGRLYAAPLAGGTPRVLAEELPQPVDLAVHDDSVYVASSDGVRTVPIEGGLPRRVCTGVHVPTALALSADELLVAEGNPPDFAGQIRALRLDSCRAHTVVGGIGAGRLLNLIGGQIYLVDGGVIKRLPAAGGVPVMVHRAEGALRGLATDGASWFYSAGTTLRRTSIDGGGSTVLASTAQDRALYVVRAANGRVYWLDDYQLIRSVPAGGGTVTTHLVAPENGAYRDFLVDSAAIYWSDGAAIVRQPLSGAAAVPLGTSLIESWTAMTLSGNELFWLNPLWLAKVRTTGGAVTYLANNLWDLGGAGALAVDDSTVYRIGAGFNAIIALPR